MPDSIGPRPAYRIAAGLTVSIALHATLIAALFVMLRHWHLPRPQGPDNVYVFLQSTIGGVRVPQAQSPAVAASAPVPHKSIHIRRRIKKLTIDLSKRTDASPAAISTPKPSADASHSSGSAAGTDTAKGGGGLTGQRAKASDGLRSGDRPLFPSNQVDEPPVLVSSVVPNYPEDARRRRIEGEVVLQFVVDRDGRVEDGIKVIESIPILDRAAIDALRKWRFSPGRNRDGTAVRVLLEVPLHFTLRASD